MNVPDTPPVSPLGYLIHDVARLMRRRFEDHARHFQLTLPQWRAMGQLSKTDGLSQVTLAGMIEADPMTVSGIIDRLETKGWVERVPDPTDSRAKLVRLTPSARTLVEEMRGVGRTLFDEALEGVSEADREVLVNSLSRICANLNNTNNTRVPQKELQS